MRHLTYVTNHTNKTDFRYFRSVEVSSVEKVHRFHTGMPSYVPTPLVSLKDRASELGLEQFLVKDESKRFGLNAFKGLGGSYAIGKYLCERLGIPVDEQAYGKLTAKEVQERLGELTFVTATDGNHGRGVAWAAKIFGQKAVVYMPKGSAQERLENIRAQGAQAEILPVNYDDAVRHAAQMGEEKGWVLVQDTAWPGYEEIPTAIMQGYTTMAWEIEQQLKEAGWQRPTHLFLQAGVGSMAGAIAGYFASIWGEECPIIGIIEPDQADCHYRTAKANDGKIHIVTGDMDSMMAGLCCGEPCMLSWEILKNSADVFISCTDEYSADGMRLLGRPTGADERIISGESGAVPAGVTAGIMKEPNLEALRKKLGLNKDSRVLVISTEGDTDKENYCRILNEV